MGALSLKAHKRAFLLLETKMNQPNKISKKICCVKCTSFFCYSFLYLSGCSIFIHVYVPYNALRLAVAFAE
jgi:hypothetical protein